MTPATSSSAGSAALESARRKAFLRLLPILFISYFVAYVDRNNVAIAGLTMQKDLPGFNDAVFGFGAGIFFFGYVLLEIPGSLMVERWSARKWICRIMITWGIMAAFTAAVKTPFHFYSVRFLLGLAEAGFFPGVIVYLTHWFTVRDRAKALSYFLVATPFAQVINPIVSGWILKIGTYEINGKIVVPADGETVGAVTKWIQAGTTKIVEGTPILHPEVLGLEGWQWVYILWAIPAVLLGVIVFFFLTDKPSQARWLTPEEREALESALAAEKASHSKGKRMSVVEGLLHPKVLLLMIAYFCTVTASYGIEFFMPKIINFWFGLDTKSLVMFIIVPPCIALTAQLFVGWSSDHFKERRYHAVVPIIIGSAAIASLPFTKGNVWICVACFMIAFAGFKGYMPAFWSLPNLFLVEAAAAGSIGLINSVGNLGGFLGSSVMGYAKEHSGDYAYGLWFLSGSMLVSASILFTLGLGVKEKKP